MAVESTRSGNALLDRPALEVFALACPAEALYDPRNGDLSLKVTDLDLDPETGIPSRTNYFTVDWLQTGQGTFWADSACYPFQSPALIFFVPYQHIRFEPERSVRGVRVQFHANFLCVETYHEEVGCNGVLFNDVYGIPVVGLDQQNDREFGDLVGQIRKELSECGLAHSEIVLSYLKVLLIRATRLKREQQGTLCWTPGERRPAILESLRELIEANYRHLHTPAEYADGSTSRPRRSEKWSRPTSTRPARN